MAGSHKKSAFGDKRWKSVGLGLRLANGGRFGIVSAGAIVGIYVLWLLVAFILCCFLFPSALEGKIDIAKDILNPFAFYGFL
jgi:hypothetical protein